MVWLLRALGCASIVVMGTLIGCTTGPAVGTVTGEVTYAGEQLEVHVVGVPLVAAELVRPDHTVVGAEEEKRRRAEPVMPVATRHGREQLS